MHWLSNNYQWIAAVVVMPIFLLVLKRWVDSPKPTTNAVPTQVTLNIGQLVAASVRDESAHDERTARPAWPKQHGAYIADSSEAIPLFPNTLDGFRSKDDKDFWGKPFSTKGTIRVFQGKDWEGIWKFPNTMNGCSSGVFMIRWRSAYPDVRVQTSAVNNAAVASRFATKPGAFGYMSGTNCDQPMFKFAEALNRSKGTTLVDIYYELKFWQAAP